MPISFCTVSTPSSVSVTLSALLVDDVVLVLAQLRDDLVDASGTSRSAASAGPLMMSGVRASSIRIESTSSTIA